MVEKTANQITLHRWHTRKTRGKTKSLSTLTIGNPFLLIYVLHSPRLTWRDIQHIVVWTSNWEPLKNDQDWSPNGVGLHVNRKFGFGLLVAEKIVELAKPNTFKTVPEKTICRGQINQDRK